MRIEPIQTNNPTFRVYKGTTTTTHPKGVVVKDMGEWSNKRIEIFKSYDKQGKLGHKLYWLETIFMKLIRAKLSYFDTITGKKVKEVSTEDMLGIQRKGELNV